MSSRKPKRDDENYNVDRGKEKSSNFTDTHKEIEDNRSNNTNNIFDSEDFQSFLHARLVVSDSDHNFFKSKDSFVSGFLTKKWASTGAITNNTNACVTSVVQSSAAATKSHDLLTILNEEQFKTMKSQDWIDRETLGTHVEVPYSGIFSSNKTEVLLGTTMKTDFSSVEEQPLKLRVTKERKKRNRKPRKKIIPKHKKYVEPTNKDVLQGRGGRSNHHPGNARYREEIERFQDMYKNTESKDKKTSISEAVVVDVQSFGGNFLEKDEVGWYVIHDVVARRKVSQALREDKDPEKRRLKRQRFLDKRSKLELGKRKEAENSSDHKREFM